MTLAVFINCVVITLVVLIHYEALRLMYQVIPDLPIARRLRVLAAVFGALIAHTVEVWVFALAFHWYITTPEMGSLAGNHDGTLLDCAYFSFINYTSLGYGDIVPHGHLRFLAGLEGLVGLVLIGWTASFIYIEMTRFWRET